MNSAPSRMKSAAIETRDEIRKSAQWTALRAMMVSSPATSAAMANTQKKSASQPERIISSVTGDQLRVTSEGKPFDLSLVTLNWSLCIFDGFAPLLQHLAVPDEAGAGVGGEFEVLRQLQ